MQIKPRPKFVTALAALAIVGGILMLIAGAIIGLGAAVILAMMSPSSEFRENAEEQLGPMAQGIGIPVDLLGPLALTEAAILLVLGFVSLMVTRGLLKGKEWAWKTTLIVSFVLIAIAISIPATGGTFAATMPFVAISAAIIYILLRADVKRHFGRSDHSAPSFQAEPT